jgi:hypothetical protein
MATTADIGLTRKQVHEARQVRAAGEILEAKGEAIIAYEAAKLAARLAKFKSAHDTVIAACRKAQADALVIEVRAQCRLADEYDAAQERGEVASGKGRGPAGGIAAAVSPGGMGQATGSAPPTTSSTTSSRYLPPGYPDPMRVPQHHWAVSSSLVAEDDHHAPDCQEPVFMAAYGRTTDPGSGSEPAGCAGYDPNRTLLAFVTRPAAARCYDHPPLLTTTAKSSDVANDGIGVGEHGGIGVSQAQLAQPIRDSVGETVPLL